jgi:hypothetical protein
MGLAAVGHHKLGGFINVGALYWTSLKIGKAASKFASKLSARNRQRARDEASAATARSQAA